MGLLLRLDELLKSARYGATGFSTEQAPATQPALKLSPLLRDDVRLVVSLGFHVGQKGPTAILKMDMQSFITYSSPTEPLEEQVQ